MTCRELAELVTDRAEGRLSLVDRLRFELHLGLCRGCRRWVCQLEATAAALGRLPEPELPVALQDELLRRFEGWSPSTAVPLRGHRAQDERKGR